MINLVGESGNAGEGHIRVLFKMLPLLWGVVWKTPRDAGAPRTLWLFESWSLGVFEFNAARINSKAPRLEDSKKTFEMH